MTVLMAYNSISRWSGALGVCAIVAIIRPAHADPRAVVELFTSQGCSSCPPADKIIGELARDPNVIALSMPIDYWDYLGWKDTLALPGHARRQRAYAGTRGDRAVYTSATDTFRLTGKTVLDMPDMTITESPEVYWSRAQKRFVARAPYVIKVKSAALKQAGESQKLP